MTTHHYRHMLRTGKHQFFAVDDDAVVVAAAAAVDDVLHRDHGTGCITVRNSPKQREFGEEERLPSEATSRTAMGYVGAFFLVRIECTIQGACRRVRTEVD